MMGKMQEEASQRYWPPPTEARMVHLLDRRSSCGQPIVITEHAAESLTPADRPVAGVQA